MKFDIFYILDKKGNPVKVSNILAWSEWFESGNRIIKQTKVGNYFISTIFLGLDHNFRIGEPILFETMVFDESKKNEFMIGDRERETSRDLEQVRYFTKKEALKGHKEMIKKYELL